MGKAGLLPPYLSVDLPTDGDARRSPGERRDVPRSRVLGLGVVAKSEVEMSGPCRNRRPAFKSSRQAPQNRNRQRLRRARESGFLALANELTIFHKPTGLLPCWRRASMNSGAK